MNFNLLLLLFLYAYLGISSETALNFEKAIERASKLLQRRQIEYAIPCISVAVSVDGEMIWSQGFGYSDVENLVPCKGNTPMRVASISKPLTVAALASLWEQGKINIDAPIQNYVSDFPEKCFNGKKVNVTIRQLAGHYSGMRMLFIKSVNESRINLTWPVDPDPGCTPENEIFQLKREDDIAYITEHYDTIRDSLQLFKDDPLLYYPETQFSYSNLGFNLVGAAIENITWAFPDFIAHFFKNIGMQNTFAEDKSQIVPNRVRNYFRNNRHELFNIPYFDLSHMWPSGGMWSTAEDLVYFGNYMLCSYQNCKCNKTQLFLNPETVRMLWTPFHPNTSYGLGWMLCNKCRNGKMRIGHTGGANGTSNAFFIFSDVDKINTSNGESPQGTVIATLTNICDLKIYEILMDIFKEFNKIMEN